MDINELETFRLSDAVKFHDRLNPKIWGADDHLLPEVRKKLMAIADDFREFLGISDLEIKDITVSGSNAAYTYTDHSDVDLHLVVDLPKADSDEVYRELFDAKKYQYNDQHNFKIGGADVELYVQNAADRHISQGIYSILNNQWISVPKRRKPDVNDISVKSKYEDIGRRVDDAIESGNLEQMDMLAKKIREMRQAGLEKTGEFGPENLAFKVLRNNGTLDRLRAARLSAKDQQMSITERKKKKKAKRKFKYGAFGGVFFPGFHYYDGDSGDAGGDGGGESVQEQLDVATYSPEQLAKKHGVPVTQIMKQLIKGIKVELEHTSDKKVAKEIALDHLSELPDYYDRLSRAETNEGVDPADMIDQFVDFCADHLQLQQRPQVTVKRDPAWSERNATFGRYIPDSNTLIVSVANRHPLDIMRTLAHELTHHRQAEQETMPADAGETGSEYENEANAEAGVILRQFAELHPEYFGKQISEASGYIPVNDKEARDPRYSMAVTVDIRPGEPQRQAAKMGWKVSPAGVPPLLMKQLENQLRVIKEGREPVKEEELEEVAMSPGALKAFADSPEAEGMMAGFEAELIFQGLGGESSDGDPMPDYNEDRSAGGIDDIVDFFSDGPYSDMSRRDIERLREELMERYFDWVNEKISESWDNEGYEYLSDFINDNDEFDEDEARDEAEAEVADREDLDDDQKESVINDMVNSKRERFIQSVWDEGITNSIYEAAYQEYSDEMQNEYNDGDWVDDMNWAMSDVENEFGLSWPYLEYEQTEGGFNEESAQRLADDLADKLDVTTTVSGGYHGARRDATTWIFEPDSSLDADDSDDMPVEIVSPPMPLKDALEILPKFFAWAEANGAYANKSTGFHMSVSMPDHSGQALDYVKLALFLGDEYVLKQFGREANTYTRSAISKIRDAAKKPIVKEDATQADAVLSAMRKHLNQFAARAVAQPSGFGKYTSINPKSNYIEFRSAGGSDYFRDMDKIQNTLMRYARATSLAMNPAAEKAEYAKKLYKLLTNTETKQVVDPKTGRKRTEVKGKNNNDAISIFSRYVAGELPQSALKSFLKQLQYGREVEKNPSGEKIRWRVTHPSGNTSVEVSAATKTEAIRLAKQEYNDTMNPDDVYRAIPLTQSANLSQTDIENRLGWGSQVADANYEIVDLRNRTTPVFKLIANTEAEADQKLEQWLAVTGEDPAGFAVRPIRTPPTQTPASDQMTAPAADDPNGNFVLRRREGNEATGPVLYRFHAANNAAAIEAARQWTTARGLERRSVWLDHVSGVPPEVLNAPVRAAIGEPRPASQASDEQQPAEPAAQQQATSSNGVPMWEIYARNGNLVVHTFADHTQNLAWQTAQQWLRDEGVTDASLFSLRPKAL